MATISENTIGVDFDAPSDKALFATGTLAQGTDGKHYQYAKASADIAAGTTVVNITVSSGVYVAAATGGSSTSPAVAVKSGQYAWFKL